MIGTLFKRVKDVHFVGIGGVGMSGIAEILLALGFRVSGSDLRSSATTDRLSDLGGRIWIGHHKDHLEKADVVVFSSAASEDNPELRAAMDRRIPVIPRAEKSSTNLQKSRPTVPLLTSLKTFPVHAPCGFWALRATVMNTAISSRITFVSGQNSVAVQPPVIPTSAIF